MKQYNTRATLAPTLATMQSNQDTATLNNILGKLSSGYQSGVNLKMKSGQAETFLGETKDRLAVLKTYLDDPTLDKATKRAYEQEWGRLTMLGNQAAVNPMGIDDILKTYYGQYNKIADPFSLANALQVAEIGAEASKYGANKRFEGMRYAADKGLTPWWMGGSNAVPVSSNNSIANPINTDDVMEQVFGK